MAVFERRASPLDHRLVGLYRLGAIPSPSFSITIPGIISPGQDYAVDLWVDVNGNGAYDPPPVDHAWRLLQSSTATGLALSFTHNTLFTDVAADTP